MSSHDDASLRQTVFAILKQYPNLKPKALLSMVKQPKKKLDYIRHLRSQWIHDYKDNAYASSLSQKELAYIAGIIDGEGHVNIVSQFTKDGKHEYFTLRISIGNTNEVMIKWLQKRLGGYVSANTKIEGCKQCYHLQLNAKKVRWLVPRILPYVIAKRQELRLLVKSFKLIQQSKRQDNFSEVKELQREIRVFHSRQGRGSLDYDRK